MPSIELVDKIDQQHKGRYYRGAAASSSAGAPGGASSAATASGRSPSNAGTNKEDLIFTVEDGGLTTPTNGNPDTVTEGYLGLEQELEYRLARRRRNRIAALASLVGAFLLGLAVHRRRGSNVAAPSPSSGGGGVSTPNSSPSSGSSKHTHRPTASPTVPPISLWPTVSPLPPFTVCPPPIEPDQHSHDSKYPIFHIGELRTVPEAPDAAEEDDDLKWEYTFSSMDISSDASIIAVGLEDFGAGTDYAVGMVRVFAYSCDDAHYRQLGQDLRGANDGEQFGHRVSSSSDGTIMAVSAPQSSYDGGNGFVVVLFLNEDANRWDRLGHLIEDLDSVSQYDRLGHAIDLSGQGETLAVLGIAGTNSYVVRVFQFNYNTKRWSRKGRDVKVSVNYEDDYDYSPQLSLSDGGDELTISDPEFGVVRYKFHFAMNRWEKQESKSVSFDDDDYWIDAVSADSSGNLIGFTAFKVSDDPDQSDYETVKIVDFTDNEANVVYSDHFEDYAVTVDVAVSDNGRVAAVVASKLDTDDDEYWADMSYVGALTVVSDAAIGGADDSAGTGGGYDVVGRGTKVEKMGVPGNFVTLSGDGRIAAVGSDNVVALYGIVLPGLGDADSGAATDAAAGDDGADSAGSDNAGDGAGGSDSADSTTTTATAGTFDICPPYPDSGGGTKAGDLDDLPKQADEHTLSLATSSDGSVVAVGLDSYDGEDRGLARVFGWSCASQSYVQMGQDLLGTEDFDGFGQSVDLSADGRTLAVGANQPPPGKSGYVEVYAYGDDTGTWTLVGHRVDNVASTVGDVGREVRISDDGTTVMFSGSIMKETDGYAYDSSFVRVVQNVNGEWKARGDDLIGSIDYDEYGSEVHIAQSGDGRTLAVAGSYSTFMAKVYTFDDDAKNWTEHVIPPIKASDDPDDDDDDDEDCWDVYYEYYFSGSSVDLNGDGTCVAVAGIKYDDDGAEEATVRVLTLDATSGNWTLSHDPVDFTDDFEANDISISSDGTDLAVGINSHTDGLDGQGALFVAGMDGSDSAGWTSLVDGRDEGDMLGSRVSITRDGTLAAASSRRGYVSFFKIG